MDSTDASSHNHQLRSKRVRNASANDDSVKLPATKKRRSALRRDTFEPLAESSINELANQTATRAQSPSHADSKTNGNVVKPTREIPPQDMLQTRDLTLRGSKKTEKRSEKGTGLSALTNTEFYSINHLPSLPERIRLQPKVQYSCVISPEYDYILALTHSEALLWSYSATSSTPLSRELVTFKLPFPPAIAEDPLPIGAFTARAANGEPGILVVSPKWGKIVYWETLTLASAYTVTQTSNAVEGSIPGMMHGEIVKELVPAEPVGFILSLASGRVAHLTVRDQLGRPGIGVQYMRRQAAASLRGGLLGSIRHVFGADRRKGTAIVRPGRSARAQRDIVICTEDADLEIWTNNLLTGNTLSKFFSIKEQLATSLERPGEEIYTGFKVVDFAIANTPISQELVNYNSASPNSLIFLAAASKEDSWTYFLVEAMVSTDGTAQVRVVHPLRDYTTNLSAVESEFRPRISISHTSAVAFVILEKAIIIASLAKITESPSSQLAADKSALPLPFQDCVRLRSDKNYAVINFTAEENESSAGCIVAIHGYGLMRIESHLKADLDMEEEPVISQLTAKSRLEQAIFFGHKPDNPLDLTRSFKKNYAPKEIRRAVLDISREIVKSNAKHIPKSSSSIAEHLHSRARLLQQLAEYALKAYPNCINRADRFHLLWDAEQIAGAQALWKVQEKIQSSYPKNERAEDQDLTYFDFALATLSHKGRKIPEPEKGETDHIRYWLVHDVLHISELLAELADTIHELDEAAMHDPLLRADFLVEGTELWTAAFQTAFRFREDNAAIWGLGNETFENGVLFTGYPQPLYEVWTSINRQAAHGKEFVNFVCKFLEEWWNFSPSQQNGSANPRSKKIKQLPEKSNGEPYDAPSKKLLRKLADRLPTQVELLIRVFRETRLHNQRELNATEASDEEKERETSLLDDELRVVTAKTIREIAAFNRNGALQLAEAQGDTDLLVQLNLSHIVELANSRVTHPDDNEEIAQKIEEIQNHVETYFDRFGNTWAYSHFSSMIDRGELSRLIDEGLSDEGKKQSFLSWFFDTCLQDNRKVGKISWINDVVGQQDYNSACQMLEVVAHEEEDDIWSQKTELCLAKLAGLAALEADRSVANESKLENISTELRYLQIIESLAFHINSILYDAVDNEGAVEIAIGQFLPKTLKKTQTRKTLSTTLYRLVTSQTISLAQLVDALTLLDLSQAEPEDVDADLDMISGEEYAFALRAIALAPAREANDKEKGMLKKMVWRRLLTKDNWIEINKTAGKSDQQVKAAMQSSALYLALVDCIKRSRDGFIGMHLLSFESITESETTDSDVSEEAKAESAVLKKYIEKARLQEHYEGLLKEAKDEVRLLLDQEGDNLARDILEDNYEAPVNGGYS